MTRRILAAAALAALLLPAACRKESRRPTVILISIDTLRADHLPVYGYDKVATPAIDALRRDSILFSEAYSHVPLTLPSHVSLLTGLLPPRNGVRDNLGYVLSPSHATLATMLKRRGYATGAAVSAVVLMSATGVSQGFDEFDDKMMTGSASLSIGEIQRSGYESEKVAESWIAGHERDPFFYFLHLYEPHTPYDPPEPFKSRYAASPYDGEIATADDVVGRFLQFLRARNLYDSSLVVLVADHGEGLGDHGEDEHGVLLYRETLHVPLLVKLPRQDRAGQRVDFPVGLVDVVPTVLEVTGTALPGGLSGRSLLAGGPPRRIYGETFYPRYHFGWGDLASLTDQRYQYIHGSRDELFNLVSDPAERNDLSGGLPSAFRSMRNELFAMDRPEQTPGAADAEQVQKLASLGYLGAGRAPAVSGPLPDPRDHIGEIRELKNAVKLDAERKHAEAADALREVLRRHPRMSDGWGALANALHKLGKNREAIEALRHQDALQPGDPNILASFATEYLELGDTAQAELYARRSIAIHGPAEAHQVLASVYLAQKNYDAAQDEAERARGGYRSRKMPDVILAQVRKARGDLPGALRILDSVEADRKAAGQGPISDVAAFRGDILARMGRSREAEDAFHQELEYFPNNPRGWAGLAILYASEGRGTQARETLQKMVRNSPSPRTLEAAAQAY
ncbi:MAG: sulfatase-like hydrolase/transferase, partial [Thermoanaerobaculia bacterium]